VVLQVMIAPDAFSAETTAASTSGTNALFIGEPA